jgi:RHS repeat-associated protein
MEVASLELSSTPQWYFYSSDHLGTPRLKTGPKPQGAPSAPVVETYRYRAFGEAFAGLTPANRPGFEFAMMERDPILPEGAMVASGSGHHYVHARFFADRFARFLSPDQLSGSPEDPQSWNRYTYARNNPLKYVDPDGRATHPVTGGSGIPHETVRTNRANPRVGFFGFVRNGGTKFHHGVDLTASIGTRLVAPISGTVTVTRGPVGGLSVAVEGADGTVSVCRTCLRAS